MKNNYVDNEKFLEEIRKYRVRSAELVAEGKEKPRLTNYLGKTLYDIANNLSLAPNFINYSFRQEMVSDAIETMLKYFDSYDVERTNPFAYFTTVAWQAFVSRIDIEEKNRYLVYKNFERTLVQTDGMELLRDEENNLIGPKIYDNISEFISNFERKQDDKRLKRLEKKKLKDQANEESSRVTGIDPGDGEPS